jgi:hypothetical protein
MELIVVVVMVDVNEYEVELVVSIPVEEMEVNDDNMIATLRNCSISYETYQEKEVQK